MEVSFFLGGVEQQIASSDLAGRCGSPIGAVAGQNASVATIILGRLNVAGQTFAAADAAAAGQSGGPLWCNSVCLLDRAACPLPLWSVLRWHGVF